MIFFRRFIFPAVYGLIVYFTVRLLHDTEAGQRFWRRDPLQNGIEITCSIVTGYAGVYLFGRLIRYYDKRWPLQFCYQNLVRELLILVISNLLLVNVILTPMAALTDDGLSWADLADICTIPTLYAIVYYGIARSRTYMMAYVDNRVLLEKVTNDHLQTELKFLKAQYHPHFLFNALNTIYFQMDEDIKGAKTSIEKFSELLRYQLYDQQQQVPVSAEIEYLESFISLQKIRSTDKLQINANFDPALNGQMVYPLLFLPLVENAFKFVGGSYKLDIDARLENDHILFKVVNSTPGFELPQAKSGGIGLENLKRRLDLLYNGRYQLDITAGDDTFTAIMKLQYE